MSGRGALSEERTEYPVIKTTGYSGRRPTNRYIYPGQQITRNEKNVILVIWDQNRHMSKKSQCIAIKISNVVPDA